MDERLKAIQEQYTALKNRRTPYEAKWSDLQKYVRINASDFVSTNTFSEEIRSKDIFDSTAPWALEQFASGINTFLTSNTERWFQLGILGEETVNLPREAVLWLEQVSDRLYYEYSIPHAAFSTSLHECYLDIGGFGTCILFQDWNKSGGHLQFRAFSLSDCFVLENSDAHVDTLFRKFILTNRQLMEKFPVTATDDKVKNQQPTYEWNVVHAAFPRKDRNIYKFDSKNKAFASVYFSPDLDYVLDESGYDSLPYHVGMWTKMTGEAYGRGPGESVLPSIRMINKMMRELIVSAELANSPPMVIENESLLLPVDNKKFGIAPRSILWKEVGAEFPQPIMSGNQPQLTQEIIQDERENIIKAYFVDSIIRARKKERQTTVEIMDERTEMLRQMSPMFGRIEGGLLGPMLGRSYALLDARGEIPEPPDIMDGATLEIIYINPAAKAQIGTKATQIGAFLQDLSILAPFDPSVIKVVDMMELARELSKLRDVSRKVIKSKEVFEAEMEREKQLAEAQAAAQALPDVAGSIKSIAEARETDPDLVNSVLPR